MGMTNYRTMQFYSSYEDTTLFRVFFHTRRERQESGLGMSERVDTSLLSLGERITMALGRPSRSTLTSTTSNKELQCVQTLSPTSIYCKQLLNNTINNAVAKVK
jgi:hypothetical protein